MSPFDVSWMIGRHVNVTVSESSYPWRFDLGDSCFIIAECPWRILQGGEIRHSSENHAMRPGLPPPVHVAAEANRLLDGSPIVRAEIRHAADLLLDFDGEVRLEVLPFVRGYESWQLYAPQGRHILAGVDGRVNTSERVP
jgi:hypothetical protein